MRVLFRAITCIVAAATACRPGPVGRSFSGAQELVRAVGADEVVAARDVQFPAQVVRIETGDAARDCPAADGRLQVVVVEHEGREGVLVVRGASGVDAAVPATPW